MIRSQPPERLLELSARLGGLTRQRLASEEHLFTIGLERQSQLLLGFPVPVKWCHIEVIDTRFNSFTNSTVRQILGLPQQCHPPKSDYRKFDSIFIMTLRQHWDRAGSPFLSLVIRDIQQGSRNQNSDFLSTQDPLHLIGQLAQRTV